MSQVSESVLNNETGRSLRSVGTAVIPEKMQFLSGSALKLIAVLSMLCDHVAYYFVNPDAYVLVSAFGKQITLYWVMRLIGRMAFPIFAFLIVEGAIYTRNRLRYGVNLFVFALISEVPWDLVFYGKYFDFSKQNVFFTLFLGYLGICLFEKFKEKFWLQLATLAGLFVLCALLRSDYSYRGYCFILLVYVLREQRLLQAVITGAGLLPGGFYPVIAYVPLILYNGKRGFIKGSVLKYAFYAFYPAHLLVLFLIKHYL